jgi:ribonuclease P protein component
LPEDEIKIEGIKGKRMFKETLDTGQKISSNYFLTYIKKTEEKNCIRVGFIVTKKIGNAIVRNKIKRRIREALRNIKHDTDRGIAMVFIARKAVIEAGYLNITEVLKKVLGKIK